MNLAYPLPSGAAVKFLDDGTTYLGTQLEVPGEDSSNEWLEPVDDEAYRKATEGK